MIIFSIVLHINPTTIMKKTSSFWENLKDRAVRAMQIFNVAHSAEDGYATREDYEDLYK